MRVVVCMLLLVGVSRADEHREEAKRLRDLSVAAKERGDLPAALAYCFEAMEFSDTPNLHFNAALILEELGRDQESLDEFKTFLAQPSGDLQARPRALEEVERISRRLALPTLPEVTVTTAKILPATPKRDPKRYAPWLVGGGALAFATIGAGLFGSAAVDFHSLQHSCAPFCATNWQGIRSREYAGEAFLGLAGVAVAVDVALIIYRARRGGK